MSCMCLHMQARASSGIFCCAPKLPPPAVSQPRALLLQSLRSSSKITKQISLPCEDPLARVRLTVHQQLLQEEEACTSDNCMEQFDDDPILKPSLMPFEIMCRELQVWRARFGSCHVPHRCFDAAELGSWVRYIRRQHRRKTLQRWKADRLNLMSFHWDVSREDARWYANLHHLRHFKTLNLAEAEARLRVSSGLSQAEESTAMDLHRPFDDGVHGAWRELYKWVQDQGKLLTAGQLPLQKQQALTAVGITLRVDGKVMERNTKLQGLNAHERRLTRKRWKIEDSRLTTNAAHKLSAGSKSSKAIIPPNHGH